MPWKMLCPDARRQGAEALEKLDPCCSGECAFLESLWSERVIAELRGGVKTAACLVARTVAPPSRRLSGGRPRPPR